MADELIHRIDLYLLLNIATEAGEAILEVYYSDFTYEHKEDATPLTLADRRSHEIIVRRLKEAYPDIPIVSEESENVLYKTTRKACVMSVLSLDKRGIPYFKGVER